MMRFTRRRFPIGIQNFEKLRKEGHLYVDKTGYVYDLACQGGRPYFLSRPRRFGKSLFLSTLRAYFEGKKELFEGLAIAELEQDWVEYPILYLDLNNAKFDSIADLEGLLNAHLILWEERYGKTEGEVILSNRFANVIRRASQQTGKGVVVLVDEYDKPLLQNIHNTSLLEEMKMVLKAFYGTLKSSDEYLRFVMLTGVTKFGQVSVFSDLNQLIDISMLSRYSAVCGVSEEELEANFEPELHQLAESNEMTYDEVRVLVRRKYNGYHFSARAIGVYNPFSLLHVLEFQEFKDYWFATGTPTFLVELLSKSNYDLSRLEGIELPANRFGDYKADATEPIPVIYQSGYLTIKKHDARFGRFVLGFPNDEVKYGFLECLLPAYTSGEGKSSFDASCFVSDLESGNVDGFMNRLKGIYAGFPYELMAGNEHYYNSVLYLVFTLVGQYVVSQVQCNLGRADAIVETADYVYVFELKLNGSAADALVQIEEKGYAAPYALDERKVYCVGVAFDADIRNVKEWLVG